MSFDPKTSFMGELNWLILNFTLIFMIFSFWKKPSRTKIIFIELINQISNQFKIALKTTKDSSEGIFISLFIMILFMNMMGLFPNIFTPTSHITMNMMISLPLWIGFMAFGWSNFTNKMLSHLVPNGTPTALISFMVMIELISNFIRSLTLSIRLMANMVSGHLLLTLMGNLMENSSISMVIVLTFIQSILSSLELGVAFIQAYVFCMLLTLYSNESDYN
ncbi:ATP synthase F0 subunit 6 (mitochondrion) [Thrips palmi]|uniref:ATP synthase subunit a n=1 Tax=Thrips palmi TaxID=161013 RepID=A0A386T9K1_THRPL|nr:ATP synthase F0 subunit 6 [Thrips palmi]AYE84570.1 ATP synthase F0 subunit 6 [Thrips palmi]UKT59937.1 ATP synthase F0 subunit 6 [Thrips palmi]